MFRAITLVISIDFQVAERLNFAEQLKSEREKQQKVHNEIGFQYSFRDGLNVSKCSFGLQLSEEEEVKRLRKELVPRAQPMPFFDRPFVPKK